MAGEPAFDPQHPDAPPTAVLPLRLRTERNRRLAKLRDLDPTAWHPIEVVVVRVLLPPQGGERLFIKCPACGPAEVDPIRLAAAWDKALNYQPAKDDATPYYVSSADVADPII